MTSETTEKANTDDGQAVKQPDFAKVKVEIKAFFATLSVWDFVDLSKPWVMVPHGSFMGAFDFVPPMFREGPWKVLPMIYIFSAAYVMSFSTVYHCSVYGIQDLPHEYYEAFSIQWFLNLAGFLWTSYVFRDLFVSGLGAAAMATFTVHAYSLICLRFGLSTLLPFFPSHKLAVLNELLRYPILNHATITFVIWNFVLFPGIFFCIKDEQKRKGFIKYFTNFRLTQLHFFNIFFAVFSGLWGTPSRALHWADVHAAGDMGILYLLFYYFVLDRLGIHLYMILSPRTNMAVVTWLFVSACTLGLHYFWSHVFDAYGGYWEQESTWFTWSTSSVANETFDAATPSIETLVA